MSSVLWTKASKKSRSESENESGSESERKGKARSERQRHLKSSASLLGCFVVIGFCIGLISGHAPNANKNFNKDWDWDSGQKWQFGPLRSRHLKWRRVVFAQTNELFQLKQKEENYVRMYLTFQFKFAESFFRCCFCPWLTTNSVCPWIRLHFELISCNCLPPYFQFVSTVTRTHGVCAL